MTIDEAVKGLKVQAEGDDTVYTVKYTWGYYVALEIVHENGSRVSCGMKKINKLKIWEGE